MVTLRLALGPIDCAYFLKLRNGLTARLASRRGEIPRQEHEEWFATTDEHLFVAENEGTRIGTLRLSRYGLVSIIVDPQERGKGWGLLMLQALDEEARSRGIKHLIAEIAPENERSQVIFLKAGYVPTLLEKYL